MFDDRQMLSSKLILIAFMLILVCGCASKNLVETSPPATQSDIYELDTATGRVVPIRAIYPTSSDSDSIGVMVFSHGAFSDYDKYDRVLNKWAESGFVVIAIRHIDSPQNPLNKSYPMEQQWLLRLEDMRTVNSDLNAIINQIDNLERAVDQQRLVMAGHSYGAITAMAVAGAVTTDSNTNTKIRLVDPGVKAVIAMSPPGLIPNYIEEDAFQLMSTPLLVQTGTADVLENFIPDWKMHKAAYELSPAGHKWLTVGTNVDHYFGGLSGRFNLENAIPQTDALESFVSLSRLFLTAYAEADSKALFLLKRKAEAGAWSESMTLEYR